MNCNIYLICGLESYDSQYRPVGGSCEHGNELLDSVKGREFPE